MNIREYQAKAMSTYSCPDDVPPRIYTAYLLKEEVGELSQKISKHLRDGAPITREQVVKELGDILWSIAAQDYVNGQVWGDSPMWDSSYSPRESEFPFVIEGHASFTYAELDRVSGSLSNCLLSIHPLMHWEAVCRTLRISCLEVAETNIAKLADRKNRGVIGGGGDER